MILTVKNLSVTYGTKIAVDNISFGIEPGEVIGLLGANGAGKSSTIAAVLGIEKSKYEELIMLGKSPILHRKEVFQEVGVQFQDTNFQDKLIVREACEQWGSLYRQTADIPQLLQTFGLAGKENQLVYIHALSATKVVEKWLREESATVSSYTYSRKEVALLLDITPEAVRNWERNGLITVPRLNNGKRAYGERELEQLRVIRSLRSAHYSINAILRLLRQIQQPSPDIVTILNTPTDEEDIVSVTDQLGKSLLDAIADAKNTLALLHEKTTFQ